MTLEPLFSEREYFIITLNKEESTLFLEFFPLLQAAAAVEADAVAPEAGLAAVAVELLTKRSAAVEAD